MAKHPSPAPTSHQFTQSFTQWDGTPNKATIKARRVKNGWVGSVKIGLIQQTITGVHPFMEGALNSALRKLTIMKEHAVND